MNGMLAKLPITESSSNYTVAVKDSIDIAGLPTCLGSKACENTTPAAKDAVVVSLLKNAGYSIIGKTVMHELAFGMTGVNPWDGTPVNSLFPDYIPGGSSCGSATAVASGEVNIALGTDTGGSVRVPAACCGVLGLKTTFGLVSRSGVWPEASSLDCVGVFAKKPQDLLTAAKVLLPADNHTTLLDGRVIKLAWMENEAINEIQIAILKQLKSKDNVLISNIQLPYFNEAFEAGMSVISYETWQACYQMHGQGLLGDDVEQRLTAASKVTDVEILAAGEVRKVFSAAVDRALEEADALVLPALPNYPMSRSAAIAGETDLTISKLVRPFNLSGHPALSIPIKGDKPVSMQLVGRRGDDLLLCQLAEQLMS